MKIRRAEKPLKEHVNGVGLWCVTIKSGEYISIGESMFIGAKNMNYGDGIRLALAVLSDTEITHFKKKSPNEGNE